MNSSKVKISTIVYVFVSFLFQGCFSQKFDFPRPLNVSGTCDRGSPLGDLNVDGSLTLTVQDLQLFQPKVIIQAVHEICDIDLTSCFGAYEISGTEGCFCTKSANDVYQLHIRASKSLQLPRDLSGSKLQASIPSQDAIGTTVAGVGSIGSISRASDVKANATYQVDGQPAEDLQDYQTVRVCPNKYEGITICARNRPLGSSLRVTVKGQQQVAAAPCVKMVTDYDFSHVKSYELSFVIEESTGCAHIFRFDIKERQLGC